MAGKKATPVADMTPRAWVDLLIEKAKPLRDAGVLKLAIGDVHIDLAAKDEPQITPEDLARLVQARAESEEHPDPLMDPATFGRKRGVPGFPVDRDDEQEELDS